VILKEGTDESSGRGQIISNINSCQAVVDVVKTTLGKFSYACSLRKGETFILAESLTFKFQVRAAWIN
jgi:chaperonin GroEL (HSP60 family)